MKNLTPDEYNQLCQNSTVLAADGYGDKVLLLSDQTIIKLFRVKRIISSAVFYSPARRFAKNAKKLQHLSIPTVSILKLYNIKSIKRSAVHYRQLEGVTVRDYIHSGKASTEFFSHLGQFLAHLHKLGVFFRSAHFGNIIYTSEKQFGLIDISDMKIHKYALNRNKRLRNMKHIFRLPEDIKLVQDNLIIEKSYLAHCGITKNKFQQKFLQVCQKLKQN